MLASINGFNINTGHNQLLGRLVIPRSLGLPPLFFTDIEPEIRCNTINFISGASLVASSSNSRGDTTHNQPKIIVTKKKSAKSDNSPAIISSCRKKIDYDSTEKLKSYKSHRAIWQTRYNELKSYQSQNGHCMLPQSYLPNPKLGWWVMQQRRQYTLQQRGKKSSFDGPDGKRRIQLLNDIGFIWRVERGSSHGSTIGFRNRMQCNDARSTVITKNGVVVDKFDANDFEKYMIENSENYSDDEIRAAWRRRFEYFR